MLTFTPPMPAGIHGNYPYKNQLLAMSQPRPVPAGSLTPLKPEEWARNMHPHPDTTFTGLILAGITGGFRIGFNHLSTHLESAHSNMRSALDHPDVVNNYLALEKAAGRIGILPGTLEDTSLQTNPFGVYQKN